MDKFEKLEKLQELKKGMNFFQKQNPKSYPVISECPVCHHDLHVSKLECNHCSTTIEGTFVLSKFNYLDIDKLYFIELFVKNRGNIKAIEKEMDLSYPTIKKILDEVITDLGYNPDQQEPSEEKQEEKKMSRVEILEKIDRKEITVEEAANLLKKLK